MELAVIAPSLILLIFFVIQASLYFYARSVALQSGREALSQARLQTTPQLCRGAIPSVSAYASGYADQVGGNFVQDFTVSKIDCGTDRVTVTVTAQSVSLIGFHFSIEESVSGPVEHFQDLTP